MSRTTQASIARTNRATSREPHLTARTTAEKSLFVPDIGALHTRGSCSALPHGLLPPDAEWSIPERRPCHASHLRSLRRWSDSNPPAFIPRGARTIQNNRTNGPFMPPFRKPDFDRTTAVPVVAAQLGKPKRPLIYSLSNLGSEVYEQTWLRSRPRDGLEASSTPRA